MLATNRRESRKEGAEGKELTLLYVLQLLQGERLKFWRLRSLAPRKAIS
jgi:hypothetical protein